MRKLLLNIEIENIPDSRIAYIRQTGPYGQTNVKIMEELKSWARNNGLLNEEAIILGIAHDNPELTDPDNCRYDTCLVIDENYRINDGYVKEGRISGGKYAVFLISHTSDAVQKAWLEIFSELSRQDYQMDGTRPILERYKARLVKEHYCEICVPVN
jgi:DNA gyrase inhibitor GyrI